MILYKALFVVSLVLIVYGADLKYAQDPEALCLDGTPGSYYLQTGSGSGIDKWLIYFEGGSWIGGKDLESTLQGAKSRSKGDLGSSKNKKQTVERTGIFNRSSTINPEFYNWNYIYINYCDGTGFQGHARDPIMVNGTNVYFKGEKIVKQILRQHLNSLGNSQTVLLSGCSTGGLAALTWTQYIRDLLPIEVKVFCAPEGAVLLDYLPYDGSMSAKDLYQMNFMQLVNVETDPPNLKCVTNNLNEKWKCLFAQYLIRYIDAPIFFIQSFYDSFSIAAILKLRCADDGTLYPCGDQKTQYIENHHNIVRLVMEGRIGQSKFDGGFAISCIQNCFLESFFNGDRQVPGLSGNTVSKTLQQWINDPNSNKNTHFDEVNWPNNKKCNNL